MNNNSNFNRQLKDIEFGNYYEQRVLKWLNRNDFSGNILNLYKNPYNVMDMISENQKHIIELKTRRIKHDKYEDMMIGLNKIEEAEKNPQYKYHMYFLCEDGLYGWTYTPNKNYLIKMGGRNDRGKDERKLCAFLPTEDLCLITTDINSIS